jgi:hypothetical protein
MEVRFREIDPFNCWIWLRFAHPPGQGERSYVETAFDCWFYLGKLGGFNAETCRPTRPAPISTPGLGRGGGGATLPALMHNMGVMEYQEEWARCWVDLGTSDALALDVLINTLASSTTTWWRSRSW